MLGAREHSQLLKERAVSETLIRIDAHFVHTNLPLSSLFVPASLNVLCNLSVMI
jgi:hypothetical protein